MQLLLTLAFDGVADGKDRISLTLPQTKQSYESSDLYMFSSYAVHADAVFKVIIDDCVCYLGQ